MSFTSLTFLLFLPTVFLLHWVGRGRAWQNSILLLASYVFYAWWDWRFLGLLGCSSLVDYWVGQRLSHTRHPSSRRWLLGVSLSVNLGLLGVCKYLNFFADSLAVALATLGLDIDTSSLRIVLPIGISFYTFQTLSYSIDVYRGRFQPRQGLLAYLTYVAFFPQLVAGPIERAQRLLPQFEQARSWHPSRATEGCRLILWGFAKKMLLADNLARLVEGPYAAPETVGASALLVATVGFAFQIYCDFSAYSDIAAGVGRLFGVDLMRNFRCPYLASGLREFWQRWHISFSTWLRDYVYIPLGGGRCPTRTVYRNLLITAAASGLWHGASWHFVLWGVFHGSVLILERSLSPLLERAGARSGRVAERIPPAWVRIGRILLTFTVVCVGWVLFRAATLADAWTVYRELLAGILQTGTWVGLMQSAWEQRWLGLGVVGMLIAEGNGMGPWVPRVLSTRYRIVRWTVYSMVLWLTLLYGTQRSTEFIYFQF